MLNYVLQFYQVTQFAITKFKLVKIRGFEI